MKNLQILEIEKDFDDKRVLFPLRFDCAPGITSLLGSNGAGKTTLLSILGFQLKASRGSFVLEGLHSQKHAQTLRRHIGFVGHSSFLYQDLTVEENLLFFASLYQIEDVPQKIQQWADFFSLTSFLSEFVSHLSRGMTQRVTLARALLHDPKLLLLDEPFTGLDLINQEKLLECIQLWKDKGNYVLFTTHHLDLAAQCADHHVFLHRGKKRLFLQEKTDSSRLQTIYQELQRPQAKTGFIL